MNIAGFQKTCLVDFPDMVSSTIFTLGCNIECGYCHNIPTLVKPKNVNLISEDYILDYIVRNKHMIDGVTITGGEPTIQKDLIEFMHKVKNLGFLIKLDTNGTNFEVLKRCYDESLIDLVAMDIKSSLNFNSYEKICQGLTREYFQNIKNSIKLILSSKIDYEFRTTVIPNLHSEDDLLSIINYISGAKKYYLQEFKYRSFMSEDLIVDKPFNLIKIKEYADKLIDCVEIR